MHFSWRIKLKLPKMKKVAGGIFFIWRVNYTLLYRQKLLEQFGMFWIFRHWCYSKQRGPGPCNNFSCCNDYWHCVGTSQIIYPNQKRSYYASMEYYILSYRYYSSHSWVRRHCRCGSRDSWNTVLCIYRAIRCIFDIWSEAKGLKKTS